MIFEELVLTDVGPFRGKHRIPLAPTSPDKPVVLFGGLNGAGKTTVLESLLLALYGPHTPANRGSMAYEKYLGQLINHDADRVRGSKVQLSFHALHQGKWQTVKVLRSWTATGDRVKDHIAVLRDGMPDSTLADSWTDYIETLAPRGVANLFFFDGEQIESFADLEVAKRLVSTAISGLLGLDLVDRLRDDLGVLERRKRTEAIKKEEEASALKLHHSELDDAQATEARARLELENSQKVVAEADKRAAVLGERLAREGGARYQAADEVRAHKKKAEGEVGREKKSLIEKLGGLGPLTLVDALLERTITQGQAEQRQADNLTVAALLAERDAELLDLMRTQRASAKIQQAVEQFLTQDIDKRKTSDGVAAVVGTSASTLGFAQSLLAGGLDEERAHISERVDELGKAQEAFDEADRAAGSIQEDWAVAETLKEHQQAIDELTTVRATLQNAERDLADAVVRRKKAEQQMAHEFKNSSEALIKSQDYLRIVDHASRAQETLAKLRAAATQQHVQRIEALILDSLRSLLRKDNLITDVKIDPVSCQVTLLTHNGREVRPGALSAGERQLLAVSLLAGLARASGRMLPVVIDTPLGRLDQDHRKRLIQRYLPQASHQVLVLSTDTEITPQVLGKLGDSISHMVKLEHDAEARSSVVREGYFTAGDLADEQDEDDEEQP